MKKTYVPDTSVIINGSVSEMLEKKEIEGNIIIHNSIIAELEHLANTGKTIGLLGLEEIKKIRDLCKGKKTEFGFEGERPTLTQRRGAKTGEIDALIIKLALEKKAVLVTSDLVQAQSGEAYGIEVIHLKKEVAEKLAIEYFFDEKTMSVHLKENIAPKAKKGKPGIWTFEKIREEEMSSEEIKKMEEEIIENARTKEDSFIEIQRKGSTIFQLRDYRIVITKPPFSDTYEITATRPVAKLKLGDYKLKEELIKRFEEKAEGILIAGAPGMGKTTFAQALAEFYFEKNKIVKTIESPRDLKVPKGVTRYSKNVGRRDEIQDVLLLSRPDYTIFDEMRNTPDFRLFSDLRLSGIGLVGVVHAATAIDAIQRFVGRLELGMIPSVIDTVVFIKDGQPEKVFELKMVVKVPTGMVERDLARPIIEIRDFKTKQLEFEIYVFGEETAVIPVKGVEKRGVLEVGFEIDIKKTRIIFLLGEENARKAAEIKVGKSVYRGITNAHGEISFKRNTKEGKDVFRVLTRKKKVKIKAFIGDEIT